MSGIKVYTLEEVAQILHLTRRTLYSYVHDGKLKAVKIGKYWRVTEENLADFIDKGATVSDANRYQGKR